MYKIINFEVEIIRRDDENSLNFILVFLSKWLKSVLLYKKQIVENLMMKNNKRNENSQLF